MCEDQLCQTVKMKLQLGFIVQYGFITGGIAVSRLHKRILSSLHFLVEK